MSSRPHRSGRPLSYYPSIDRPKRAAKATASTNLVERSLSPTLDTPRRDSHANEGKRKRDRSEESNEQSGAAAAAAAEGEYSESGMDLDDEVGGLFAGESGDDDVNMEEVSESESDFESTSEVKTNTRATNRKLTSVAGANKQGMRKPTGKRTGQEKRVVRDENGGKEEEAPSLSIQDGDRKMKLGDHPRFYAKIIWRKGSEDWDKEGVVVGPSKPEVENIRLPDHPPTILPRIDLSILQCDCCAKNCSEIELVRFAMSPRILPLLKMFAFLWLNPDDRSKEFHKKMLAAFPLNQKPWNLQVDLIADFAAQDMEIDITFAELLYGCTSFARRLVESNATRNDFDFFSKSSKDSWATNEPYKFSVRLLLAVWEDVETNPGGFFRTLFRQGCELGNAIRPEVRQLYECWYVVDQRMYKQKAAASTNPPDYHNHHGPKPVAMMISNVRPFQERENARANSNEQEEGELREGEALSDREAIQALKALQPDPHPNDPR